MLLSTAAFWTEDQLVVLLVLAVLSYLRYIRFVYVVVAACFQRLLIYSTPISAINYLTTESAL